MPQGSGRRRPKKILGAAILHWEEGLGAGSSREPLIQACAPQTGAVTDMEGLEAVS